MPSINNIIFTYDIVTIINKPVHFDTRIVNLLDSILITDSITVIDTDTIPNYRSSFMIGRTLQSIVAIWNL